MNFLMGQRASAAGSRWRHVLHATTAITFALSIQAHAFAQGGDEEQFDIPPSEMTDALQTWSEQADVEIIYAERDVADKVTNGVDGSYSKEAALDEIIEGTDLVYEINEDGVVVIRAAFVETEEASVGEFASREIRVAQVSNGETATDANVSDGDDEEEKRDVIVVIGTNIRGIAPESSPVRTFDREDILSSGVSTAQDFIQLLPQNFGGGSNPDTGFGLPNDISAQFNDSFGASVNLRGLGSGSTLVLLNGHRLAPSSGIGDFVDISMIPASAIDRVEVLTDGASSIYGADAVAGVVNFVLRDDFDGAEASLRYGTVTEGDLDEYRASITGGKSWDTGNALVVYEYFNQDNLSAGDRVFSQGAVLPSDLLPSQERHSVLASTSQELASDLKLSADFSFSQRDVVSNFTNPSGDLVRSTPTSENLNVSAGGAWKVSEAWFVDFSGAFSSNDTAFEVVTTSTSAVTTSTIDNDSTLWTADAILSGTLFQLPGGDVKLAIGGQFRTEDFTNIINGDTERDANRDVYAAFGEALIPIVGPDNAVPGITRLEVNVSGRFEDFSDFGSTSNPKVGVLWSPFEALRLRGSYGTSFNPPPLGRVGASDAAALVARTSLVNSLFGFTSADPSIDDVVALFITGTGTDLIAETSRAYTAGFDYDEEWNRHNLGFRATYFDIEFENRLGSTPVPDGRNSFDAQNIAFSNPELFPDETVVFFPTQPEVSNFLDTLDRVNVADGSDPLDAAIINNVLVVRNIALTSVAGFDFEITYTIDSDAGEFSVGLDATYLMDFQQQAAATTPLVEQVDTLFNPVDLRVRGRVGYANNGFTANLFVNYTDDYRVDTTATAMPIDSWTTVDVSLSYDTREKLGASLLDNTILRLSVRNLFDEDPPLTPGAPGLGIFGYDPTNASPLNRFVTFELTKAF